MLNPSDLYAQTLFSRIIVTGAGGRDVGTLEVRYEVRQISNVRDLQHVSAYRIHCTQRLVIPNEMGFALKPSMYDTYTYPALVTSKVECLAPDGSNLRLLDYQPRTLNSTITTSSNQNDGSTRTSGQQHTTGSSTAQTNSYSTSLSLGFFGADPTGSIGAESSHATTTERSRSDSAMSEFGMHHERSSGESMSVKDWAGYACLDRSCTTPSWVWGQEHPWDVIKYRGAVLPDFVLDQLRDKSVDPPIIYPPSHLALFGIDFVMKAAWQVDLLEYPEQQRLSLKHTVELLEGGHGVEVDFHTFHVWLGPDPIVLEATSPVLDLTLLGLDPILGGGADNGAVIGFAAFSKFILAPWAYAPFKIISEANTLQVTGAGFTFDQGMMTDFQGKSTSLCIQFKVIDSVTQYALFMKHWKLGAGNCVMTIVINGDQQNPLQRHIDWKEGEGGEDNLTTIVLRNKDYTSIDYHDYLVMGLNTIDITLSPQAPGVQTAYALRALAIGEV